MALALLALPALAETTLRIATFNTELEREGPGLLLRDILSGQDNQVDAVARVIADARPDVIALQGVDYDHDLQTLAALRDRVAYLGHDMPHIFANKPNSGLATGLDLDGDGRFGRGRDAQGYGEFAGQGGMAILSRYPIQMEDVQDFTTLLWRDLPGALVQLDDGAPLMPPEVAEVQRLSSVAHWSVPIKIGETVLRILSYHATPPVFDGPEDRNGRRNHDETAFWLHHLEGSIGTAPKRPFVIAGDANLDPVDGDGRKEAITALLNHSRLQDPAPKRPTPVAQQEGHQGDPRLDTVDWPGPELGARRVSYILPSADLRVLDSGIMADPENTAIQTASRHRLVWVDVVIP